MRLLCAAALTLTVGLFVVAGDDKKDPPKGGDRAKQVRELEAKYDQEFADLKQKFRDAKTPEEQDKIRTRAKELTIASAKRAYAIAAENPADEAALDAATFVVAKCRPFASGEPEFDKSLAILIDHHMNNPRVAGAVAVVGRGGPGSEKILAAADKSSNPVVRGAAEYARGMAAADASDDEDEPKKSDELAAKAVEHLEKAAKLAPDTKLPGETETIGASAKFEIASLKGTRVGSPAVEVTGTDLEGKKQKLSGFKGKVVLLDVWATWCPPCRGMIPHERAMVERLRGKPFVLVSVSGDREKEDLTEFLKKNEMLWVHWWDGGDRMVLRTYRVQAFPTLYLIDHAGVIRNKWVGAPKSGVLDDAVDELVAAAEKDKKG